MTTRRPLFIFADLAGHFDAFMNLLKKAPKDALIILLGDVNDKGKDSAKIIQYLIDHPEIIWLMGNHEHMLTQCHDFVNNKVSKIKSDCFYWIYVNGGAKTLKSYGLKVKYPKIYPDKSPTYYEFKAHYKNLYKHNMTYEINELRSSDEAKFSIDQIRKIPKEHIDHIKTLPLFYTEGDIFCSHAHLNQEKIDKLLSLKEMNENETILDMGVLWNRNQPKRPRSDKKFIVYGHMNVEQVFNHTRKHPKGKYSLENKVDPNAFGVCFDLTSQGNKLAAMEWPTKILHTEPIVWEDDL